eukprot:2285453-Pleurochrysis_carterae.AAC.1
MTSLSHLVWCCCFPGTGQQHKYCKKPVETFTKMMNYIKKEVGCTFKDSEFMCCEVAHFSPGVARGGRFTKFTCSCCGYSPTETKWLKAVKDFEKMSDEQQESLRQEHNEVGKDEKEWGSHHHQHLYMASGIVTSMDRAGVDGLHLAFLNAFKHLFNYTVHQGFRDKKKKLVKAYLKKAGFYSYDAAATDENSVMRWIGREVKRNFLAQADVHLPFLLRVAAAPAGLMGDNWEGVINANGKVELEEDEESLCLDDEDDTPADAAGRSANGGSSAGEEDEILKQASMWHNFLALVRCMQAPWAPSAEDSMAYRELRAVQYFNLGNQ